MMSTSSFFSVCRLAMLVPATKGDVMATLLRIDSSSRLEGSHSRALGDEFQSLWGTRRAGGTVLHRDLAKEPIQQIGQTTIAGFYTPADQMTSELHEATKLSDNLIAELQSADCILITVPIYNFGVPAALKAWIDQVVRIGHTFSYDGANFGGLVKADRAIVITAYGAAGYLNNGPLSGADFVKPYLAFLLGFLGIGDVRFVGLEATTGDAEAIKIGFTGACQAIRSILEDM